MIYKCWFPGCKYETTVKSLIENHHITPREINSSPMNKVTIPLCPVCHKLIYHPGVKSGQHTVNTEKSIKIISINASTHGKAVVYEDYNGKMWTYYPSDGEIYAW